MDTISLSTLKQLTFKTQSVVFKDKNHIAQLDGFDQYGVVFLAASDVEIKLSWRSKSLEAMNTHAAVYHIEVDHSSAIAAEINRLVTDRRGHQFDPVATSTLLVSMLKAELDWLMAVDDVLAEPRLRLVSSQKQQTANPYPNLCKL